MRTRPSKRRIWRERLALRGLEILARAIGIGAFVALAVHTALGSYGQRSMVAFGLVAILAPLSLALALRLRARADRLASNPVLIGDAIMTTALICLGVAALA